jgi:hypothetical protein
MWMRLRSIVGNFVLSVLVFLILAVLLLPRPEGPAQGPPVPYGERELWLEALGRLQRHQPQLRDEKDKRLAALMLWLAQTGYAVGRQEGQRRAELRRVSEACPGSLFRITKIKPDLSL